MSQVLVPCSGCSRHVRHDDGVCPFCASPLRAPTERTPSGAQAPRVVVALAAALTASASLAACYGGPPRPQSYEPHRAQPAASPDGGSVLEANKP